MIYLQFDALGLGFAAVASIAFILHCRGWWL